MLKCKINYYNHIVNALFLLYIKQGNASYKKTIQIRFICIAIKGCFQYLLYRVANIIWVFSMFYKTVSVWRSVWTINSQFILFCNLLVYQIHPLILMINNEYLLRETYLSKGLSTHKCYGSNRTLLIFQSCCLDNGSAIFMSFPIISRINKCRHLYSSHMINQSLLTDSLVTYRASFNKSMYEKHFTY